MIDMWYGDRGVSTSGRLAFLSFYLTGTFQAAKKLELSLFNGTDVLITASVVDKQVK